MYVNEWALSLISQKTWISAPWSWQLILSWRRMLIAILQDGFGTKVAVFSYMQSTCKCKPIPIFSVLIYGSRATFKLSAKCLKIVFGSDCCETKQTKQTKWNTIHSQYSFYSYEMCRLIDALILLFMPCHFMPFHRHLKNLPSPFQIEIYNMDDEIEDTLYAVSFDYI